jgi:methyltransferase (TIGR00027 family)
MVIDNITDMARVVAYARAVESERADAIFHDPFARQLAGERGAAIVRAIGDIEMVARGLAVRTAVVDELLLERINQDQVELVINLGAGLDTRPWRMALPPTLQWVDADLPEILKYKSTTLRTNRPTCTYQALPVDILNGSARTQLFARCSTAQRVLVVSEGLLVYLSEAQVAALAKDLHGQSSFLWWLTDLTGPRALEMLRHLWGPQLGDAQFQFGPADAPAFFSPLGWRELLFRSSRKEARRLRRAAPASMLSSLILLFSSAATREEFRRLSGVAVFGRDVPATTDSSSPGR